MHTKQFRARLHQLHLAYAVPAAKTAVGARCDDQVIGGLLLRSTMRSKRRPRLRRAESASQRLPHSPPGEAHRAPETRLGSLPALQQAAAGVRQVRAAHDSASSHSVAAQDLRAAPVQARWEAARAGRHAAVVETKRLQREGQRQPCPEGVGTVGHCAAGPC
jgi:hypothetical protein